MNQSDQGLLRPALLSSLHCGAGCTLGDLVAEWLTFFAGWTIAGTTLLASYVVDFIAAFLIGIAFQYFAVKGMKQLSRGEALKSALKADTLSISAFQIGMYGWMAITRFLIFERPLHPNEAVFWFMMQIGMLLGLATTLPVNAWLVKSGVKEKMS